MVTDDLIGINSKEYALPQGYNAFVIIVLCRC